MPNESPTAIALLERIAAALDQQTERFLRDKDQFAAERERAIRSEYALRGEALQMQEERLAELLANPVKDDWDGRYEAKVEHWQVSVFNTRTEMKHLAAIYPWLTDGEPQP